MEFQIHHLPCTRREGGGKNPKHSAESEAHVRVVFAGFYFSFSFSFFFFGNKTAACSHRVPRLTAVYSDAQTRRIKNVQYGSLRAAEKGGRSCLSREELQSGALVQAGGLSSWKERKPLAADSGVKFASGREKKQNKSKPV